MLKNLTCRLIDLPGSGQDLKELQAFRIALSCTLKALVTDNNLDVDSWLLANLILKKISPKYK